MAVKHVPFMLPALNVHATRLNTFVEVPTLRQLALKFLYIPGVHRNRKPISLSVKHDRGEISLTRKKIASLVSFVLRIISECFRVICCHY